MDPHERRLLATTFDQDAAGYDAGRPDYPAAAWDIVLGHAALGPGKTAVEIGAGTGQATGRLLATGAKVHAVEPGASMADLLRQRFAAAALEVHTCALEDVDLPEALADAVLAATSFHWVDPELGLRTVRRVLKPGAPLSLWWNVYRDPAGPTVDPVDALVRNSTALPNRRGLNGILDDLDLPGRLAEHGFADIEEHTVRWEATHTESELIALFRSFSDMRKRTRAEREHVLDRLRMLVRESGGTVTRLYTTPILLARAPGSP